MLEVIDLENEKRWLDIVKQFENCEVYYLPGYAKAFQINGDGEPTLFYYESQSTKAINVVMKRDIAQCQYFEKAIEKDTLFDISTPYGYGGLVIEGDADSKALAKLNEEYIAYCMQQGIVSEFVRFHPLLENHLRCESIYEIRELGRTISMDLSSREVMNVNVRSNTRRRIRKAKELGIEVSNGNTWDLFMKFKELYDETMDRNKANQYYYFSESFYKSIMNDLKDNVTIFYATLDGEILAMQITLLGNNRMYSHLQGSKTEHMHLAPVAIMDYESAVWGHDNGMEALYLGGGFGAKEDNLYFFKSNFNRNSQTRFVTGRKIFDKEKYADLLEIRREISGLEDAAEFFPGYRA